MQSYLSDLRKRVSTRNAAEAQGSTIQDRAGTLTAQVAQLAPVIAELTGVTRHFPPSSTKFEDSRRAR